MQWRMRQRTWRHSKRERAAELNACVDEAELRAWNTKYFGDKGELTIALKALGTLPKEQRAAYGQAVNRLKQVLSAAYDQALAAKKEEALLASLSANPLDVTLPGRPVPTGGLHVATKVMRRDLRHLRRHGLSGVPLTRSRGRPDELRAAEHAAAPSGARHVGHVPHDHARRAAENAHVAWPDSRDAAVRAEPRPRRAARHVLSARSGLARAARFSSSKSKVSSSARTSRWPI